MEKEEIQALFFFTVAGFVSQFDPSTQGLFVFVF